MTVHVQREARRGVAQVGLHGLDIVAVFDRDDGVAVPEVMESLFRHSDLTDDLLEMLVYGEVYQVPAQFIRKDQINAKKWEAALRVPPLAFLPSSCYEKECERTEALLRKTVASQRTIYERIKQKQLRRAAVRFRKARPVELRGTDTKTGTTKVIDAETN